MKRFLSLLTVFVLAFALAVPVGATDYNGFEVPNVESIWDKELFPYSFISSYRGVVSFNQSKQPFVVRSDMIFPVSSTSARYHVLDNGVWAYGGDFTVDISSQSFATESSVKWVSHDVRNENGELIFPYVKPLENLCDGSACPATDENIDGICDDCGMMLMSLSRTPVPPEVDGNNQNSVLFYSGTVYQYTIYSSDSLYTIRGQEYGARYRTYLDPAVTVTRFESYDGLNWSDSTITTSANDYPGEVGWELISSTFDWYTEEGEHFFPVPLWAEVEKVTQGEMTNLTTETAGTMTTLVVCGVGLMACLMVLSLFGKRWLLFLR